MSGKEIISKMKEKVGLGSSAAAADSGKGKSRVDKHVTHGYHLVKGRSNHPMEDYIVSEFRSVQGNELGLFAIFDGHLSQSVPDYLRSNLFDNILKEVA
ncbi:Probable protein phosphatase 2C 39 [Linum perenne]